VIIQKYVEINKDRIIPGKTAIDNFWKWKTFNHYSNYHLNSVGFILGFTTILAAITYISILNSWTFVGEIFGGIGTILEIGLNIPQILQILEAKSAKGISNKMIAIWLCSDIYKTIYFISNVAIFAPRPNPYSSSQPASSKSS
jgi:uncharacterized protein with PQ loop repeat